MIAGDNLGQALFDVTFEANAAARLAPPPAADARSWWRLGSATWVRALPVQSVQVQKPDETRFTQVRFRANGPGLEADENADWGWAADAVKGLAAELVLGLLRQLDASVPALPARARPLPPDEPQLDWPGDGPGDPEARRRRRIAGSVALADYLGRVAVQTAEGDGPDPGPASGLAGRLIRHLSAIPRPAETRLSLSWNADEDPILSWDQRGNPELLWGASVLSYSDLIRKAVVETLPPEEAEERCRLGAWGHLLAMASGVEAATGGLSVPLRLRYRTVGDRPAIAFFTIAPGQWGFDLARMVLAAGQRQVPDGLYFQILG